MKKEKFYFINVFLILILIVISLAGCSGKKANLEITDYTAGTNVSGGQANGANTIVSESQVYNQDMDSSIAGSKTDGNTGFTGTDGVEAKIQVDVYGLGTWTEEKNYGYPNYSAEEYNSIVENDYVSVLNNPLSTFSVDVDTASYSNIRRMIYGNQPIDPNAVRLEEMINYFKYNYKEPESGNPFSVNTELSDCPWNENAKLLLIGLKAKEIDMKERPSSNIVFLLDVSGSMDEGNKLPLMQKAFIMLTENLNEKDRISIVTYAGEEQVVLKGARGDETMKISSAIEDLTAGGSTAGSAGIESAYDLAEEYYIKGGNNRVILATDGDLNVGITSEEDLTRLIEEKRKNGVFLSVLGFGTDNIKDNKMEALADNGNGNYSYIDSLLEAKKVLVEEMGGTLFTIAKDVKLQVEFNPEQIKGYRLIGYENRLLNTEDFEDDTKDAGEIGAGHRVTALYELLTADSVQKLPETRLKYQKKEELPDFTNSKEWLTINIRYKDPDKNKSKLMSVPVDGGIYTKSLPDNLAFASSVASFGMLLRDSKWKGSSSYDMILDNLNKADTSSDEYKDEFVSLVKKMKRYNTDSMNPNLDGID
ncbi:vWA domain-containing protein [Anaerocolumna sp. MB42-C2]|uniref:vWA domain-containing protein n=1 Tax=Anaerocolumna sp. MB42-C2 TaxID=3070997 RepID=UPI0027DFFAFE|nr:VWA domain-containing protein [Anaerocolumna sp. MB42-C2]WMJ88142.1 VWA domain-containing protein [Anaerocolumna sp. MB42-C2]